MLLHQFQGIWKKKLEKFKDKNTQTQIFTYKNAVNTANILLSVYLQEIEQNQDKKQILTQKFESAKISKYSKPQYE